MPFTLAEPHHSELLIRKSRFIGCVEPIAGRAEALVRVATLRRDHPTAAHVCWALLAGGESAAVDDGEPGGTAGRPMMEVLRRQDLDGVLASVVRYFGGVKLGAGGLVRAYTDAVAQALLAAPKLPLQRWRQLACSTPYMLEGLLRRELESAGARSIEIDHGMAVDWRFSLPENVVERFVASLAESGQGRIEWRHDAAGPQA